MAVESDIRQFASVISSGIVPALSVSLLVQICVIFLLVRLSFTVYGLFIRRWRLQGLTKNFENAWGKKTHFLFGDIHLFPPEGQGRLEYFLSISSQIRNIFTIWVGPFEAWIHAISPEYVKAVLTNADTKNNVSYVALRPWLGDGLLTTGGEKWKRHRRLLTPGFHYKILKPYVKVFGESANVFMNKLAETNGRFIDVFEPVSLMTLDSLLKCSFSYESNCQIDKQTPYIKAVYEITDIYIERLRFFPYHFDTIFFLSPMGRRFVKQCQIVHQEAENTIRKRKEELERMAAANETIFDRRGRKYLDFLDILLEAKKIQNYEFLPEFASHLLARPGTHTILKANGSDDIKISNVYEEDENGEGMDDLEIREDVDTFLFGGHDTTACAISWCLYNLARHPDYQQKCREEIQDIMQHKDNEEMEWEDLSKLEFTTMFIKESMRFHPPVPQIVRTLVKDVQLPDGSVLPKGTAVGVSMLALHRHPLYWENPDVFDPYRFSPENVRDMHSHAYVPFSAGPRNCIGKQFAMNEIKVTIAMIIRRFHISRDPDRTPEMVLRVVLRSFDGIHLKFMPVETMDSL